LKEKNVNSDEKKKEISVKYATILINLFLFPTSYLLILFCEFQFIITKIKEQPYERIAFGNYVIYPSDIFLFYTILITLSIIFVTFVILREIIKLKYLCWKKISNLNYYLVYLVLFSVLNLIHIFLITGRITGFGIFRTFFEDYYFYYFIALFGLFFLMYYCVISLNRGIYGKNNMKLQKKVRIYTKFGFVSCVIFSVMYFVMSIVILL